MSEKMETTLERSEISEIKWIKKENIQLDDIAFDSQKKFLKEYFEL